MALILLAALGVVLVVTGVALIHVPSALIVAGLAAMAAAYLIAEERDQ